MDQSGFKKQVSKAPLDPFSKYRLNTLDDLISVYGVPKFIKIDVEGYEEEVLNGLTSPIEMISFEYTVPEFLIPAQRCIDRISMVSSHVEYNYCSGEKMCFKLNQWITSTEMKEHMETVDFLNSGGGDIYARLKMDQWG